MEIAAALDIGRKAAQQLVGAEKGGGYSVAFGAWLKAHPKFNKVPGSTRMFLFKCLDNLSAIEEWRARLEPEERLNWNYPQKVCLGWILLKNSCLELAAVLLAILSKTTR